MYTIRKCIEELQKVGGYSIRLYNGTVINIEEIYNPEFSTVRRNEDGSPKTFRRIMCYIIPNGNTRMMDDLKKKYWMYNPNVPEFENYFLEGHFRIPERIMNQFISYNGGIDHYETIGVPAMIAHDMRSMCDDIWI